MTPIDPQDFRKVLEKQGSTPEKFRQQLSPKHDWILMLVGFGLLGLGAWFEYRMSYFWAHSQTAPAQVRSFQLSSTWAYPAQSSDSHYNPVVTFTLADGQSITTTAKSFREYDGGSGPTEGSLSGVPLLVRYSLEDPTDAFVEDHFSRIRYWNLGVYLFFGLSALAIVVVQKYIRGRLPS